MAATAGPQSIKSRIAALNLEEVHAPSPDAKPTYSYDTITTTKKKPPPPPPTSRPPRAQPLRQHTVNNPPILSDAPTSARQIGNQPAIVAPSPRLSPALPPRPPPRNNSASRSGPSPALPPRKASHHDLRRQGSNESVSTIASGISTLSLGSVKTNGTGHSNGTNGSIYTVRAPAYDPTKLPPLPVKTPNDPRQTNSTLNAMKSKITETRSRELPPMLGKPGKHSVTLGLQQGDHS